MYSPEKQILGASCGRLAMRGVGLSLPAQGVYNPGPHQKSKPALSGLANIFVINDAL